MEAFLLDWLDCSQRVWWAVSSFSLDSRKVQMTSWVLWWLTVNSEVYCSISEYLHICGEVILASFITLWFGSISIRQLRLRNTGPAHSFSSLGLSIYSRRKWGGWRNDTCDVRQGILGWEGYRWQGGRRCRRGTCGKIRQSYICSKIP